MNTRTTTASERADFVLWLTGKAPWWRRIPCFFGRHWWVTHCLETDRPTGNRRVVIDAKRACRRCGKVTSDPKCQMVGQIITFDVEEE